MGERKWMHLTETPGRRISVGWMVGRIFASLLFVAGGAMAWGVMTAMQGMAWMLGALSAQPAPERLLWFQFVPWLVYGYYVVSAVGVLVAGKRRTLLVVAVVAHALMLSAAGVLAYVGSAQTSYVGAFVAVLEATWMYFGFWVVIWVAMVVVGEEWKRREESPP